MEEIAASANALANLGQELQQAVERFKLGTNLTGGISFMRKLKKFVALTMLAVLALALPASIPALAAEEQTKVDGYQGQNLVKSVVFVAGFNKYFVNGQTPGVDMDVAPYIDQDRTFVPPVRYLGYALGVKEKGVNWDNDLQKASLTLPPMAANATPARAQQGTVKSVVFKVGVPYYFVNNQVPGVEMYDLPYKIAPFIEDGRVFVPVRFLANALGVRDENIVWNVSQQAKTSLLAWLFAANRGATAVFKKLLITAAACLFLGGLLVAAPARAACPAHLAVQARQAVGRACPARGGPAGGTVSGGGVSAVPVPAGMGSGKGASPG